ncbi:MAG: hypothetical protein KBC43_00425 [Bacteroidales bacterium]|nr:hypothetical protein [Bacteroidales bacterium]
MIKWVVDINNGVIFELCVIEKTKNDNNDRKIKTKRTKGKEAITLIWIILTLEVVSLISGYFQYDLLNSVANGGEISTETANANDSREQIIGIVYMIA